MTDMLLNAKYLHVHNDFPPGFPTPILSLSPPGKARQVERFSAALTRCGSLLDELRCQAVEEGPVLNLVHQAGKTIRHPNRPGED
jgi:hypothetical protein